MSRITLHLVTASNAAEIIDFELENRAFFARSVPDRGDEYFALANMERFLAEIEAEQSRGECYLHLVRNADGELVGRVNLVEIQPGLHAANLGYRIAAKHGGQGHATEAVRLALEVARGLGLHVVKAMTTVGNIGSQIVLLRNGFQFRERFPSHLDVNGTLHDGVFFRRGLE